MASTILLVSAAAGASSVSGAPAIWMGIMFIAMIPWAMYSSSDHCRKNEKYAVRSNWVLGGFAFILFLVLIFTGV